MRRFVVTGMRMGTPLERSMESRGSGSVQGHSSVGHLERRDIDQVNPHGTGIPVNPSVAIPAVKKTFGEMASKLPISSSGCMIGRLIAASGVEAIPGRLSLGDRTVSPTINLDHPHPEFDLDDIPNNAGRDQINTALCGSFGFAGQNIILALRRFID